MTVTSEPVKALEAEQQVLAACLNGHRVDELNLRVEDFYQPRHGLIWQALVDLTDRGDPTDPVSVLAETRNPELAPYLVDLCERLWVAGDPTYHAGLVAAAAVDRRVGAFGVFAQQLATSAAEDKLTLLRERLDDLDAPTGPAGVDMNQLVDDTLEWLETDRAGIRTGYPDLDEYLNPLLPGQFLVVAGRPGDGKSSLLLGVARRVALTGQRVLMCSLEMGRYEITCRLLADAGRAPLSAMLTGSMTGDDWAQTAKAAGNLADLPLVLDDTEHLTLAALRALIRREQRRGVALVTVDYLQLIGAPKAENRQNEVAQLSRGLKLLARGLGVPVMVAAQLNRTPTHRSDKRPALSDLRESGAIEQDADVVILLHRDEDRPGETEVILAKQRNGPTASVRLGFQGAFSRFVDLAGGWK